MLDRNNTNKTIFFRDGWKKTPVKAVQLEEDTLKAFDLYYLADSNNILLNKDNCDLSGDDLFSVQFHSSHVEDRRHRQRPWNG